jgi:hypothetical protein
MCPIFCVKAYYFLCPAKEKVSKKKTDEIVLWGRSFFFFLEREKKKDQKENPQGIAGTPPTSEGQQVWVAFYY